MKKAPLEDFGVFWKAATTVSKLIAGKEFDSLIP